MPAPLVVHVGLAPDRARALAGPPDRWARHLVSRTTSRADVVVLHGRAARRAPRLRHRSCLVIARPDLGAPPSWADRRSLRWVDLVAVRSPAEAAAWTAAIARPPGAAAVAVIAEDEPHAWNQLVHAALAPAGVAAERDLDGDLLLAPAAPTGSVERLTGSGPAIWRALHGGRTPQEAAEALRPGDPGARADVEAFAARLADQGLVPA